MADIKDLERAEQFYKTFISAESGLMSVSLKSGIVALEFTDLIKMATFSVESVAIGDSVIKPMKIFIGETKWQ